MTTGEGGMVLGNDAGLMRKVARLRSHGITRDPEEMAWPSEGGWYYQQIELGYNYRMTDLQAALGSAQLVKVDAFVMRRRQLVTRYNSLLADLPLVLPQPDSGCAWHLYPVQLHDPARRRTVFDALRSQGIAVNVHYIPVHQQPWYRRMGFKAGDFPFGEAYYAAALSLPLYPGLSEDQQDYVVQMLRQSLV
jgi:dTDP-4-amino-4,6-dideoxygalactose transaminase